MAMNMPPDPSMMGAGNPAQGPPAAAGPPMPPIVMPPPMTKKRSKRRHTGRAMKSKGKAKR